MMERDFLFLINCRKARELCSKKLDGTITHKERFLLRFHLLLCSLCRNTLCQFQAIQKGIRTLFEPYESESSDIKLPEEAKVQIKRQLIE